MSEKYNRDRVFYLQNNDSKCLCLCFCPCDKNDKTACLDFVAKTLQRLILKAHYTVTQQYPMLKHHKRCFVYCPLLTQPGFEFEIQCL